MPDQPPPKKARLSRLRIVPKSAHSKTFKLRFRFGTFKVGRACLHTESVRAVVGWMRSKSCWSMNRCPLRRSIPEGCQAFSGRLLCVACFSRCSLLASCPRLPSGKWTARQQLLAPNRAHRFSPETFASPGECAACSERSRELEQRKAGTSANWKGNAEKEKTQR